MTPKKLALHCLFSLTLLLAGCEKKDETLLGANLPDISSFASSPSDQFIIDSSSIAHVSRAHPYKGAGTSCAHQGAHLHFMDTGFDYTVDMRAPADGVVLRITPCFNLGNGNDKYEVDIGIAKHNGQSLLFEFSLEPFAGLLCQSNSDFYKQFILVSQGQTVQKGQVIARLNKKTGVGGDATHVHFDLQDMQSGNFHCPNIFTPAIAAQFGTLYGAETCSGTPFPATLCYQPAAGEDLTGL